MKAYPKKKVNDAPLQKLYSEKSTFLFFGNLVELWRISMQNWQMYFRTGFVNAPILDFVSPPFQADMLTCSGLLFS